MTIKNIDTKTLKKWLDNNEAIIIDVREPAEHSLSRIAQAQSIPLAQICKKNLPNCSNKKLVLHCQLGGRSSKACQKLLSEDSGLEIYNLEGGIASWIEQGNEVETKNKFLLPLNRQVHLAIGSFVFAFSMLGYFVNPLFCFLAAFFGAGLVFAGLSGFCGLALLMAKMPWNLK